MQTFKSHISDLEYNLYIEALNQMTEGTLNELSLPSFISDKINFIKTLASELSTDVKNLYVLFKNKIVYKFFSYVKWSIANLFALIKKGFHTYKIMLDIVAEYVAKSGVVKWTDEKLKELDIWLKTHPKLKRLGGVLVGSVLIYIWFNMTFTGDHEYDFDMTDIMNALSGDYSLSDLFSSATGVKMLMLFVTGSFISFPWPGHPTYQFTLAVIKTLSKKLGISFPSLHINKLSLR